MIGRTRPAPNELAVPTPAARTAAPAPARGNAAFLSPSG
jgi:hypothetical protein